MFLDNAEQQAKTMRTFSERDIFPIVPSSTLLRSNARQKILQDIRKFSEAPDDPYDDLYQKLIKDFADFVQLLPANNEGRLGSLLDEGLLRGLYVLQLQQEEREKGKDIEPVMNYTVFSAALMFDIGCVIEDRTVVVSDRDGGFVRYWLPYDGPMSGTDGYYKIRRGGGVPPWVSKRISVLLARQLLPAIGFRWIAEDAYALNIWLALLNNDRDSAGAFSMLLDKALDMVKVFKTSQDFFMMPFDIDVTESETNALAEEFLEWLRKNLEAKRFSMNDEKSLVHLTKKGVFLDKELFKKFIEESKKRNVSFAKVFEQMRNLGLVSGDLKKYGYAGLVMQGSPFASFNKMAYGSGHAKAGAMFTSGAGGKGAGNVGVKKAVTAALGSLAKKISAEIKGGAGAKKAEGGKIEAGKAGGGKASAGTSAASKGLFSPPPLRVDQAIGTIGLKEGIVLPVTVPFTAVVQNMYQTAGITANPNARPIVIEIPQEEGKENKYPKEYDYSRAYVANPQPTKG